WSFFTAMIGCASTFGVLLVMRLGCGLGQAGAYPTAGSILSRWVPFSNRGRASGLVALGGRLGAVIAPILTAYLMVVFVPLSTPAEFTPRAILDGPALCERLSAPLNEDDEAAEPSQRPIEQRLFNRLPATTQATVLDYGRRVREFRTAQQALQESQGQSSQPGKSQVAATKAEQPVCTETDLNDLAHGLNGWLTFHDLFRADDFARLKNAEREAQQLQKRRLSGESLTESETTRLNRLFLEGVFAKELGKLYVRGWRPVLILYGLVGLLVGAVFWLAYRNSPAEHPWCNPAEQTLIEAHKPVLAGPVKTPPLPWRAMLRSASLWGSSISQFGTNVAWVFFVTFFPRYLAEVYQVPILERSVMTAIPAVGGIAGMLLGGWLTDILVRAAGLRVGRAIPMIATRFLAAATYLACLWIDTPWPATLAFCLGFFFVDLGVSATWAFMQDVGGKHVGAILGWGNMWGNLGAAVAPPLYDLVLGPKPTFADWNLMFMVCAGNFVLAGVAALGIDATKPILNDDQADDATAPVSTIPTEAGPSGDDD
ncbi:MAG: MFS transporter, partial [Planctomycetes bacterium]|nr:MFS transporter [Planctomycetota bacterium]